MQYNIQSNLFTQGQQFTLHVKVSCEKISMIASTDTYTETRPPLDLVAVVDRSGSMAGSPMRLVKDTLDFLLNNMLPQDQFSLISYSDQALVHFPLTLMDEFNVTSASRESEKLQAGGQTNLSAGLYLGAQELLSNGRDGAVKTILLMTDGIANKGHYTSGDITNNLKQILANFKTDVTVNTFGFGKDHSEDMLSKIAECGNGMYYYIEEISNIGQAYTDCFGGLISTIAYNTKVLIQVPIVEINWQLSGSNCTRNGDVFEFNLKELQKDDERDIVLTGTSDHLVNINKNQIKVKFQCNNVISKSEDVYEVETVDAERKDLYDCEYQKLRIKTSEAYFAALDDRPNALTILNQLLKDLDSSEFKDSDSLSFIINEVNDFLSLIQRNDNTVWKKIVQSAMSHKYQRSSGMELESHKKYRRGARTILLNRYRNRENYKRCHNCGSGDHYSKDCNKPEMCHNCKGVGHRANECPVVVTCHHCKKPGHWRQDCPEFKCNKCGNIGHAARECLQDQISQNTLKCYNCGKPGHWARDCPQNLTSSQTQTTPQKDACYNCGNAGHKSRDCPQKTSNQTSNQTVTQSQTLPQNNSNQGDACFKCGKAGHWSRDCPQNLTTNQNQTQTTPQKDACYHCGNAGHKARDCPQKTSNQTSNQQDKNSCFNCGKSGHKSRDCPQPKNRSGRRH